jgi:release factor glutamine methyltransferase
MTIAQALAWAVATGMARLDAQLLLLHALGRPRDDRAWLLAHDTTDLSTDSHAAYVAACHRRLDGEPLAYLVGEKEFFGLPLKVDHRVLVPRPDTETLVEWALEVLAPTSAPAVLDLGTGSGAIALAIQSRRPDANVVAVDRSAGAVAVARENAQRLELPVQVRQGDWFEQAGNHDVVVSNPPYVAAGDRHLDALGHEPREALVAGDDGLADLRRIVADAPGHLRPGGWLLLEHGWDQAEAVRGLLTAAGFGAVHSRRDLAGVERCSGGRWLERG